MAAGSGELGVSKKKKMTRKEEMVATARDSPLPMAAHESAVSMATEPSHADWHGDWKDDVRGCHGNREIACRLAW